MYIQLTKKHTFYKIEESDEWINIVKSKEYRFYIKLLWIINSFNIFKSFIKFKLIKIYNLGGK